MTHLFPFLLQKCNALSQCRVNEEVSAMSGMKRSLPPTPFRSPCINKGYYSVV